MRYNFSQEYHELIHEHYLRLSYVFASESCLAFFAKIFSENQTSIIICLQCFDAVSWAAGRASGL